MQFQAKTKSHTCVHVPFHAIYELTAKNKLF